MYLVLFPTYRQTLVEIRQFCLTRLYLVPRWGDSIRISLIAFVVSKLESVGYHTASTAVGVRQTDRRTEASSTR